MIIELDTSLEVRETEPTYESERRIRLRDSVLKRTITPIESKDAIFGDSATPTANEMVRTSLPEDADMYHISYLEYLSQTYANHHSFVISPDIFWYTMMCDIAWAVGQEPDTFRNLFTTKPDQETILVEGADPSMLEMTRFREELRQRVPTDIDLFMPKFSTTTENSEMAILASFMETVTPYYCYMMYMCGHPKVKIMGTSDDWALLVERLVRLSDTLSCSPVVQKWLYDTIIPAARQIKSNSEDVSLWQTIFSEKRCGSGGQKEVNGWWSKLFMKQPNGTRFMENFPTHISTVPYTYAGIEGDFKMCWGLFSSKIDEDGFAIPDFSFVVNHELPAEKNEKTEDGIPEIKVVKQTITAKTRKLKGEWVSDGEGLVLKDDAV